MSLSIFNLFNIGIGPSSSHTVGPMRAARFFTKKLRKHGLLASTVKVKVELYGSLALTGIGHGSDRAILAGLEAQRPEETTPAAVFATYHKVKEEKKSLLFAGEKELFFNYEKDLIFNPLPLPHHPNGMIFYAYDQKGQELYHKTFYSIGGGFIVGRKMAERNELNSHDDETQVLPYRFHSARDLISICTQKKINISDVCWANETILRPPERVEVKMRMIWQAMNDCMNAGLLAEGTLPGKLKVKRRAKEFHLNLLKNPENSLRDPLTIIDWVNLYALAVNEENAAGGRVVTAPTNGAAGIIPAVLKYHQQFCNNQGFADVKKFLLTAGAIGILFKKNASISGAEVGCQGEVGVACSMAAGGLTEVLGGTPQQVENAAEIAMEHNLGLTCDPVEGQVQIPCIERNAMGAIKAINAARMALRGSGEHVISLDQVMRTMLQTGLDMREKYKETAQGGLAVNITEC